MATDDVKLLSWSCVFCREQNYRSVRTDIPEGKIIPLVCRRCDTPNRAPISTVNIISDRRHRPRA